MTKDSICCDKCRPNLEGFRICVYPNCPCHSKQEGEFIDDCIKKGSILQQDPVVNVVISQSEGWDIKN